MSRLAIFANAGFFVFVCVVAYAVNKYMSQDSDLEILASALVVGAAVGIGAFGKNRLVEHATRDQP